MSFLLYMKELASRNMLYKMGKMPVAHGDTPDLPPEDLSLTRTIDTLRPASRFHMSDYAFWYSINLAACLRTLQKNGDKKIIWRVSRPTPKQKPTHCEELGCHFAESGTGGCPVNEKNKKAIAKFNPVELVVAEEEPIQLLLL